MFCQKFLGITYPFFIELCLKMLVKISFLKHNGWKKSKLQFLKFVLHYNFLYDKYHNLFFVFSSIIWFTFSENGKMLIIHRSNTILITKNMSKLVRDKNTKFGITAMSVTNKRWKKSWYSFCFFSSLSSVFSMFFTLYLKNRSWKSKVPIVIGIEI